MDFGWIEAVSGLVIGVGGALAGIRINSKNQRQSELQSATAEWRGMYETIKQSLDEEKRRVEALEKVVEEMRYKQWIFETVIYQLPEDQRNEITNKIKEMSQMDK